MAVHVHRSERTDTFLAGLGRLLSTIPADPFTAELVAVPTPGIERFITQSLGLILGTSPDRRDGVCANVEFPSPGALVNRAVFQACGIDKEADPWAPQRMVWPLLDVLDASVGQPWCATVTRYLDGDGIDRRFALASRIAGLFDAYAAQRPSLLLAWSQHHDDVAPDLAWQPPLWRAVRARIASASPPERLRTAMQVLADDPTAVELPPRLSVFGPTRLPTSHLQILNVLGHHREVHLWLPDASPALWAELPPGTQSSRRHDNSARYAAHPLLRSLGRDARELRLRLRCDTDEHLPAPLAAATLLGALQRQIRDNEPPTPTPGDPSLQVHACHGPTRQAEVVRETILSLLQADPTLQPRDILIMCPDLDAFAPLLSAAFSAPDAAGTLRLRIADRTPEQSNEILAALAALLELLTGRMELSVVLDFAGRTPVRSRFGFDDDDMERLEQLTAQAGIRWGLDAEHRREFGLRVDTGSWSWGMDRLLLGAAMSEQGLPLLGATLPVDDVASGDVALVGRLGELLTRLGVIRRRLSRQSIDQWVRTLSGAITDLMQVGMVDGWQLPNALGALRTLADSAGHSAAQLSLADVRWLLADLLAGRPTRSNFRSGDLTVCGLAPMRSVPHRVICLVGMDDAAFPRAAIPDGDDALARAPLVGERDVRSEDRQVLLDAIMAAGESLIVTYTGADERTNEPRPPCVPLGDLLDTVHAMTGHSIVTPHPLQPFDPRNFTAGALGGTGPFSHDPAALAAAHATARERKPAPRMALPALDPLPRTDLSPQNVGQFLRSPIAAFLRARVGITLREADDPPPEQIPIDLDGLQKWQIGNRTLRLLSGGELPQQVALAERARGELPPGVLGAEVLGVIGRDAADVATRYASRRTGVPRQVSVAVAMPDGHRLVGVVSDVFDQAIVRATYSRVKPRDDLRLWPELLCLAAAHPTVGWSAHLVGKDSEVCLVAPPGDTAREILADLVELYWSGMSSPLPLPAATAQAYAQRRMDAKSTSVALRSAQYGQWQTRHGPDRQAAEIVALWGAEAPIEVLLTESPQVDENWFDEATRFGMLARRVWEPILRARGTS